MSKYFYIILIFFFVCGAGLPFAQAEDQDLDLSISGASTIQPMAEIAAQWYQERYAGEVDVSGGGSSRGISNAMDRTSDIGMASRVLSSQEQEELRYVSIAFDTLVFIVHQDNPLEDISQREIVSLFSGDTQNWQELTGEDEPVYLVSKEIGRATLDIFEDYAGLTHPDRDRQGPQGSVSSDALVIGSNLEGATLVGGLPGGIGYISLGTATDLIENYGMPIKILSLEGVQATQQSIQDRSYPILRELNLAYLERTQAIDKFLDLLSSSQGQKMIEDHHFIPNPDMQEVAP